MHNRIENFSKQNLESSPIVDQIDVEPVNSQYDVNLQTLNEKGRIGQLFKILYIAAVKSEPQLAEIVINASGSKENPILSATGGYAVHQGVSGSGRFEIVVNTDDDFEHYDKLLSQRKASAQSSFRKMGFDNDGSQMPDGNWLAGFIFLHELGHLVDFIQNYPDINSKNEQRETEMKGLPIPKYNPAELSNFLSSEQGIKWYEENKLKFAEIFKVTTINQLVALQDEAYRNTPMEDFADRFAVSVYTPFS